MTMIPIMTHLLKWTNTNIAKSWIPVLGDWSVLSRRGQGVDFIITTFLFLLFFGFPISLIPCYLGFPKCYFVQDSDELKPGNK